MGSYMQRYGAMLLGANAGFLKGVGGGNLGLRKKGVNGGLALGPK